MLRQSFVGRCDEVVDQGHSQQGFDEPWRQHVPTLGDMVMHAYTATRSSIANNSNTAMNFRGDLGPPLERSNIRNHADRKQAPLKR